MLADDVFDHSQLERQAVRPENYSLLVIDDDEDQSLIVEILLKREGYRVQTAASAEEALRFMSKRYFDLVITDLKMPEINGFDFIEHMRSIPRIPRNAHMPIILLTACSSDLEFTALEIGADMFCEKRNISSQLLSQIEFLLS